MATAYTVPVTVAKQTLARQWRTQRLAQNGRPRAKTAWAFKGIVYSTHGRRRTHSPPRWLRLRTAAVKATAARRASHLLQSAVAAAWVADTAYFAEVA